MNDQDKESPAVGFEAARKAAKARSASKKLNINNKIDEDIMNTSQVNFEKLSSDTAAQGKEQMDALMQSGNLLAKGAENLMKTYMGLAQDSAEKGAQAVKTLLACKTLNEFTETQTRLAQDSFDQYMSGFTKLSEMSVKLASESFQPLNAQMSKSMKKTTEAAAA